MDAEQKIPIKVGLWSEDTRMERPETKIRVEVVYVWIPENKSGAMVTTQRLMFSQTLSIKETHVKILQETPWRNRR